MLFLPLPHMYFKMSLVPDVYHTNLNCKVRNYTSLCKRLRSQNEPLQYVIVQLMLIACVCGYYGTLQKS